MFVPNNRLLKDSTNLYITLSSVKACDALAEYMKGTRFAPLVAHGSANVDSIEINKHIDENVMVLALLLKVLTFAE